MGKPYFVITLLILLGFALLLSTDGDDGRSVQDLLRAYGLPPGLLPSAVNSYDLDRETGLLEVHLDSPCFAKYDGLVFFNQTVRGNLSYGSLKGLVGFSQEELFIWLPVKEVFLADPSSGVIFFDIGVAHKQLSLSLFENPPDCSAGGEDQRQLAVQMIRGAIKASPQCGPETASKLPLLSTISLAFHLAVQLPGEVSTRCPELSGHRSVFSNDFPTAVQCRPGYGQKLCASSQPIFSSRRFRIAVSRFPVLKACCPLFYPLINRGYYYGRDHPSLSNIRVAAPPYRSSPSLDGRPSSGFSFGSVSYDSLLGLTPSHLSQPLASPNLDSASEILVEKRIRKKRSPELETEYIHFVDANDITDNEDFFEDETEAITLGSLHDLNPNLGELEPLNFNALVNPEPNPIKDIPLDKVYLNDINLISKETDLTLSTMELNSEDSDSIITSTGLTSHNSELIVDNSDLDNLELGVTQESFLLDLHPDLTGPESIDLRIITKFDPIENINILLEDINLTLNNSEPNLEDEHPKFLLESILGVAPLDLHLKECVSHDLTYLNSPCTYLNESISPYLPVASLTIVPAFILETLPHLLSPIPAGDSLGYPIIVMSHDPSPYRVPDSYILPSISPSFPIKDHLSPSWLTLLDYTTATRRPSMTLAETSYRNALTVTKRGLFCLHKAAVQPRCIHKVLSKRQQQIFSVVPQSRISCSAVQKFPATRLLLQTGEISKFISLCGPETASKLPLLSTISLAFHLAVQLPGEVSTRCPELSGHRSVLSNDFPTAVQCRPGYGQKLCASSQPIFSSRRFRIATSRFPVLKAYCPLFYPLSSIITTFVSHRGREELAYQKISRRRPSWGLASDEKLRLGLDGAGEVDFSESTGSFGWRLPDSVSAEETRLGRVERRDQGLQTQGEEEALVPSFCEERRWNGICLGFYANSRGGDLGRLLLRTILCFLGAGNQLCLRCFTEKNSASISKLGVPRSRGAGVTGPGEVTGSQEQK
ncbi:hypothetical protein M5K25_023473 [Dendrobium thyrsiflorum]|uniref:Uncharacterized protein n=1 Tax=Dendrobium thyrsiflorum TaxID=117978 RepID=A0ABD0U882_DENTH